MWLRTVLATVSLAAILTCGWWIDGVKEFPGPWTLVPVGATHLMVILIVNTGRVEQRVVEVRALPTGSEGEQQAFCQQLLEHAITTGPQRSPQCELALPHRSAHEEQVADIHTGDEQDQADDDGEEDGNDLGPPSIADIGEPANLVGHDRSRHRR